MHHSPAPGTPTHTTGVERQLHERILQAQQATGADIVLLLVRTITGHLRPQSGLGIPDWLTPGIRFAAAKGSLLHRILHQRTVTVIDDSSPGELDATLFAHCGMKSFVAVPLFRGAYVVALLIAGHTTGKSYTRSDVDRLEELAPTILRLLDDPAVDHDDTEMDLQRAFFEREKERQALAKIARSLQAADGTDLTGLFERIAVALAKGMQHEHAVCWITLDGMTYRPHTRGRPEQLLETRFQTRHGQEGAIWIGYDPAPDPDGDPFLHEERLLVESVGELLTLYLERTATESQLDHERMLSEAERIAHLGCWAYDVATDKTTYSEGMARIYALLEGADHKDPTHYPDRILPGDQDKVLGAFVEAAQAGRRYSVEYQIQDYDGRIRWLYSEGEPVVDASGRLVTYRGITQDITDRKVAERQRAEIERLEDLDRFRTQFMSTAAHEINNPLTPIGLQVDLLVSERAGELNDRQRHIVEIIDRNLIRLSLLVQDMLDASRLQNRQLRLTIADTDLGVAIEEIVATLQEKAKSDGIAVHIEKTPGLGFRADARRVMQVVMNLLSNALKFTPEGGSVVVTTSSDREEVHFTVQDTGPGLAPTQLAHLFQPFTQVHENANDRRGTGLGLYISKGIVEAHGGRIWVESEGPGKGSSFHVAFPREAKVSEEALTDAA